MDKLKIKQGSFIQQTQYFIPDSLSDNLSGGNPMFFRTELNFTGFVRWTGMFGNLWVHFILQKKIRKCLTINL